MDKEEKFNNSISQVYAALREDPINNSFKNMAGQLNLIALERINDKISEHYNNIEYQLT